MRKCRLHESWPWALCTTTAFSFPLCTTSTYEKCVLAAKYHAGKALHYDHKHVVGGKRVAVQQDMYRGIWNFGWMLYEALLCAAMLAAVGVWFYYALGLVPFHAPSERRWVIAHDVF
eukprot:scaffold209315_cov21-Tisochrysis_lutea.AAC.1